MRRDDHESQAVIVERLKAEHGVQVSRSTVGGWVANVRSVAPPATDQPVTTAELRRRLLILLDAETEALERHGRRPIDLDRLAKVASSLRVMAQIETAAPKEKGEKRTSLAELDAGSGEDRSDGNSGAG
jgi:hypothetical protein